MSINSWQAPNTWTAVQSGLTASIIENAPGFISSIAITRSTNLSVSLSESAPVFDSSVIVSVPALWSDKPAVVSSWSDKAKVLSSWTDVI